MPTGKPLTPTQRQEIVDLRRGPPTHTYNQIVKLTGRPYNTIATTLRNAGLQKEAKKTIIIVYDPAGLFKVGPTELNQTDLAYILALAEPPNHFTFTIGQYRITTQDGIYFRDDGRYCPPNKSGQLIWYPPAGTRAGEAGAAE